MQSAATRVQMWGASKAVILMYHRIASPERDLWNLSVTPENFAGHLEVIRQQAQPMSLRELAAAQRGGGVPDRAVAITFDDGYADNLHHAKPLLEAKQIPATVFITTGHLDSNREFWWDELERVLLQAGTLPETLSLEINDELKQWHLGTAAHYRLEEYRRDHQRNAWGGEPGSRLAFYCSVWESLRSLAFQERQLLLDQILAWANADSKARPEYRSLTVAELMELQQGDIVEIGAHTVTHPALAEHPLEFQQYEIQRSKQQLEKLLGYSVRSFAYPFGSFNQNSVRAVKACEFEQACSTIQRQVWKGSTPFQLPRFEAQNWKKSVFEQKLNQWLK